MQDFFISAIIAWIILFTIIFFTTVQVTIQFSRKKANDKIRTQVKAWFGLIHIQSEVPIIKLADNFSGNIYQMEMQSPNKTLAKNQFKVTPSEAFQVQHRIMNALHKIYHLHQILKRFLKHIRLEKLEWRSAIGTGDAAETGVLSGIGWGVKTSIISVMQAYLTLRTIPKLNVTPHFQQKKFETDLLCMIRFRIGNAIIAGIRILLNFNKRRDKKWQNTQFKA